MEVNVLIDTEDADLLSDMFLVVRRKQVSVSYEVRVPVGRGRRRKKWMGLHRLVMLRMVEGNRLAMRGLMVDHINGNALDNRRSNLRLATARQNAANRRIQAKGTSKYKGVARSGKRWRAYASEPTGDGDYRRIALGTFDTEEAAAAAYNTWMLETHGEYALLNVIEDTSVVNSEEFT